MTTKTKSIAFEKALSIFKSFVARKTSPREVLRMVYFDGEYLQGTNSHVLLRIHKDYIENLPTQDEFLYDIHYNTMSEKSLRYPETSRMFPSYFEAEVTYKVKDLLKVARELKKEVAKIENNPIRFIIDNGNTILTATNEENITSVREITSNNTMNGINFKVNATHVINTLSKLKQLFNSDEIKLELFKEGLKPIAIRGYGKFDVLIMPIK